MHVSPTRVVTGFCPVYVVCNLIAAGGHSNLNDSPYNSETPHSLPYLRPFTENQKPATNKYNYGNCPQIYFHIPFPKYIGKN
jgi:hypothetical protein